MKTEVVVTGTGVPIPAPARAGAGLFVRRGDVALQFDCGRATTLRLAEVGVGLPELSAVLLTHHHNDHVSGLGDLLLTRWIQFQSIHHAPALPVHFPAGPLDEYLGHLLDVYSHDIAVRKKSTGRTSSPNPEPVRFAVPGREPELVFEDSDVIIESFIVEHGVAEPAVGYRITTPEGVIVFSGDTRVCDAVAEAPDDCDVLVHEVVHPEMLEGLGRESVWVNAIKAYHSDVAELGAMAQHARVKHLVLTHMLPSPNSDVQKAAYFDAVRAGGFNGVLTVADDGWS